MPAALAHDQTSVHASFRRVGDSADLYRIWIDGAVLRIEARGGWDLAVAQAYSNDIRRAIGECRLSGTSLRAIVDRRDLSMVDTDAHQLLIETYKNVLCVRDRIALIVESSFTKSRVRQIANREETKAFLSVSAAQLWLLAYG